MNTTVTTESLFRHMIGVWSGPETIQSDQGELHAHGHWRCRLAVNGRALLSEYDRELNGMIVYRGHGVWMVGKDGQTILGWFFAPDLPPPVSPHVGRWIGNTLHFTTADGIPAMRFAFDGDRCDIHISGTSVTWSMQGDFTHERLGLHG